MHVTRYISSFTAPTLLFIGASAVLGCSKADKSGSATTSDTLTKTSAASASSPSTGPTDITPVRGTIASVTDSVLTVSTPSGDVRVSISAPLDLYASVPATLSKVKESSFVGVTSVAQPDGSQRATEIHIFPEKLRGTGEGSYPMTQQGASAGGGHNTMTNGTVSSSRMTNGTAAAPRMTNGTIGKESGGTLTVQYQGGTQTITVPSDVHVTEIAASQTKLAPGAKVVVLAKKQADGTLKASAAIMSGTGAR
jgi:hypothetical protein